MRATNNSPPAPISIMISSGRSRKPRDKSSKLCLNVFKAYPRVPLHHTGFACELATCGGVDSVFMNKNQKLIAESKRVKLCELPRMPVFIMMAH